MNISVNVDNEHWQNKPIVIYPMLFGEDTSKRDHLQFHTEKVIQLIFDSTEHFVAFGSWARFHRQI